MPRSAPADLRVEDRRILDCIRVLVREVRVSSTATEQATGLSAAQLFVLRVLAREPGLSVNALAARTLTHQSSVSVVVAKLVAADFVERRKADGDARRVALFPTSAGCKLANTQTDLIQERFIAGLDRMPARTRRRLAADMHQWVAAMGIDIIEPEMFFESKRRG
jgi:DNA-binding MarR family transcriptional regulator